MKKLLLFVTASALLVYIPACKPKKAGLEIEVIDGVEYVHNPAEPLEPGRKITFTEELTIGGDGVSEEETVFSPSDIAVDKSGRIYVGDYREAVIKVFDREGHYIRTIGQKGGGPGEFQSINGMKILPDGRLVVLDLRQRRTSLLDAEGTFVTSHPWRNSHFDIFLADESGYFTDVRLYGEEKEYIMAKYDYEGNTVEKWGDFTPYGTHISRQGGTTFAIGVPYSPQSIFAGDSKNKLIYHCLNHSYIIDVFNEQGALLRKIDRLYQPLPFTQKDAEDYYAGFDRRGEAVFSKMAREVELPKVKTVTPSMIVDDSGNLWVHTYEVDDSAEPRRSAFDIFDPAGRYIRRTWQSIRPLLFHGGKMYSITADEETDFVTVKRFAVSWTE